MATISRDAELNGAEAQRYVVSLRRLGTADLDMVARLSRMLAQGLPYYEPLRRAARLAVSRASWVAPRECPPCPMPPWRSHTHMTCRRPLR